MLTRSLERSELRVADSTTLRLRPVALPSSRVACGCGMVVGTPLGGSATVLKAIPFPIPVCEYFLHADVSGTGTGTGTGTG